MALTQVSGLSPETERREGRQKSDYEKRAALIQARDEIYKASEELAAKFIEGGLSALLQPMAECDLTMDELRLQCLEKRLRSMIDDVETSLGVGQGHLSGPQYCVDNPGLFGTELRKCLKILSNALQGLQQPS